MKNKKIHNIDSSGYKTPDDYFASLDEKIFNKLNNVNHLNSIKDSGFKVPDNYFESFNEKLINTNEPKVIALFNKRNLVYISSIAAAILLLFNLSLFENKPTFNNLDIETVENYIEDENISSLEIASLLTDEHIEEHIVVDYSVNDVNIEEYLLNNADLEDLMLE